MDSTSTNPTPKGKTPTDEKLKSDVLALFKEAVEFKEPWKRKALEMYSLFRVVEDEPSAREVGHRYKGRSRVIDPEANRVLEIVTSRIARGATVRYTPEESNDIERSKALTAVVKVFLRKARFGVISRLWVKDSLITGTGFLKVTWENEKKNVRKRVPKFTINNPMTGKPMLRFGTMLKDDVEVVIDRPKIEVLDFADVYVSPWATGPLDNPGIFHTFTFTNKEELKLNPNYDNKSIDKISGDVQDVSKKGEDLKADRYMSVGAVLPSDKNRQRGVEAWIRYDLDGDGIPEDVCVTIAGDQVIRRERNPFFHTKPPIIGYRPLPVPHEYYGMGLLEAARSMFHAATALRRQRIDAGTLSLNPVLRVLRSAGVSDEELISTPGAIWHQDDPQGIQPMTFPEPSQFAYAEIRDLKRDIRDVTGATEFLSGGDNTDRATATEFVGKVEQANLKFRQMLDMFEEEALMEFGDMIKSNVLQFMDKSVPVNILGEGTSEEVLIVRPKDIIGDYDTVTETEASAIGNRQQRFNEIMQAFNLFNNDPFINQLALRRKMITEGLEWKDITELLIDPAKSENAGKKEQLMDADSENQDPTLAEVRPDDDHAVHLDVHDSFIRSDAFMQLEPEMQQLLVQHRADHTQLMQSAQGGEPMQTGGQPMQSMGTPPPMEEEGGDIVPGPGRPPMKAEIPQ